MFTVHDAGKRAYQSIWILSRRRHGHGSVMENCWIPRGHPPDPDQAEDRVRTPKEHHDRAVLSWKRPKTNETCVEHALAKHDRTDNAAGRSRTRASSWTHVMGISTSTSIAVDMDGGMASYTGAAGVGAVEGAGSDAASAAAIDGADMLACDGGRLSVVSTAWKFSNSAPRRESLAVRRCFWR